MFIQYLLRFLAIIIFLYLAWKKIRDDFGQDTNTFLWSSLGAFLIGGRILWSIFNLISWDTSIWDWFLFWNKPGFSLIAGFVSMLSFTFIYCLFDRYNFLEVVEDLLIPFIFGAFFWFLSFGFNWLVTGYWWILGLVLVYISSFWAKKYRSFYWYKSGKKGFLFLWSAMIFSFYILVVSFLVDNSVFLKLLALILGLLFLLTLVMLGELVSLPRRER